MSARKHKSNISSEEFRKSLKLKHFAAAKKIRDVHPHVDKFFRDKGHEIGKIREHSAKIIGAGAIAGSLLLVPGELRLLPAPQEIIEKIRIEIGNDDPTHSKKILVDTFKSVLPKRARPLERDEEKFLEGVFSQVLKVPARASIEGEHLNTTYGYIGAEQHLRRYPGDALSQHDKDTFKEGMAPGLGAWGYFASSKDSMTESLEETEKWYAVVQTLYLPDWGRRTAYLRDWYRYRKVLIVNTDNGNAVVAAIADSGPAAWTGKHYGGSPEVMHHLGGERYKKGPVIVFFVDDPENKIALGPVEYN